VNNRKFKIYLDRPVEKCIAYSNGEFLISAHLKIQQLEKCPEILDMAESSKSLVNSIIEEIIHIHQTQSKNAPWIYMRQRIFGITPYRIEFFIESMSEML